LPKDRRGWRGIAVFELQVQPTPVEKTPEKQAEIQQLVARGERVTYDEILAQQADRDLRDAIRPVGALLRAADAVEVVTDGGYRPKRSSIGWKRS
jgi:hypothetical protein